MSDQQGQVLPGRGGPATAPQPTVAVTPRWSPWRAVVGFGVVSLAADMVYEGARSVTGPAAGLAGRVGRCWSGWSPVPGEALALVLRLAFGPAGRPDRPLLGADPRRLRADRGLRAAAGAHAVPRRGRSGGGLRCWSSPSGPARRCAARRSRRCSRTPPARSGWAAGSACTRRWTRSARSPARCWSPAVAALTGALWPAMAVLAVPGAASIALLLLAPAPGRRPAARAGRAPPAPPPPQLAAARRPATLPRGVLAVRRLGRR